MLKEQRNPIYRHTQLNLNDVSKIKPLMESAFNEEFGNVNPFRQKIQQERLDFMAKQYANRVRVSKNLGLSPLNEDAQIFSGLANMKQLFESASGLGSIIGMGNVANPGNATSVAGGMWNPSYQPGSGDIPTYVFGLQAQIALNCIGFDLIPTIAVDTPKILLQYVDTVYGGGPLDSAENMPSYLELISPLFTRTWIRDTAKLVRATSEVIIRTEDGAGKNAMKVRFMLGSSIKAAMTVEILSTGTISADHATYTETNTLSVKQIIDAVAASATPKIVFTPTGGSLTAAALTSLKAEYASALRQNIAEASTNNNKMTMTRSEQEGGAKHKLNIISMDKQVEVEGIEIDADTTNIQIKDMAAQGINVIAQLYNGVQNQLIQTIDEVILNHLYALGVTHAYNTYQSQGEHYSLFIAAPATAHKVFSTVNAKYEDILGNDVKANMGNIVNSIQSAGYENQTTHADRFFARLLLVSEFVGQQNRIGTPDFVVLAGTLASMMKKNSQYSINPTANTLTQIPELHYTGTVYGNINVYKNPKIDFQDPRVLLGRRGNDTDPGAKFLAYDLAASRNTITPDTMAEKIRVWSRFVIADVGFYPELNYYTFVAINEYGWA